MFSRGPIQDSVMESPLKSASLVKPNGGRHKKSIFSDLMLTSLIDAFSILVIYLLIYFGSTGETLNIDKGTQLPMAAKMGMLDKNTVVKLHDGKIFVEDKEIGGSSALVARLVELRQSIAKEKGEETLEEAALVIQADRRTKYEVVNQAVLAGSQAGFSDIHFAVIQK